MMRGGAQERDGGRIAVSRRGAGEMLDEECCEGGSNKVQESTILWPKS